MTTRTLAALTLATLLAGACSAGSSDPEVLGVLVERSETASASETEPTEPAAPAEARDAPAVIDRGFASPAQEETTAPPPPPPPREPTTTEPTSEAAEEPAQLAEGAGNTYTWTQPEDPPEEGMWWVESSSLPAQDPDADPWNGARVAARDVETSGDQDPATQPVRRATCEGWIEAPVDRPVRGAGTLTVELLVNDAVEATAGYPFDGTIEAEDRVRFDRVGDVTVDARDSDTVTCTVRFDAD